MAFFSENDAKRFNEDSAIWVLIENASSHVDRVTFDIFKETGTRRAQVGWVLPCVTQCDQKKVAECL